MSFTGRTGDSGNSSYTHTREGVPGNGCPSREVKRPTAAERLENPAALLSRTDLRELGLERRAVDAVFRALPVIVLPGYRRPLVRVADYLELLERSTFTGDRVR